MTTCLESGWQPQYLHLISKQSPFEEAALRMQPSISSVGEIDKIGQNLTFTCEFNRWTAFGAMCLECL
jgi:hypothetical protein